ncbi:unnamed protein product [Bursaphelenchus xylophilus]|uniref:(pine wood nematode) hypothetical protein n=1 Tax=Bursaphelenchus xylophilus TaxID=6326 RepID=A0A1I7SR51_BURXY|nr:unnamed protein product [Bursaphelenchus xylophilus]CAG9110837.1 unnamed protein product [Bursaphelenchus xylophilus]
MTDHSTSTKYKVPAQLRPLLESFTRETLRNQPSDLIAFGRLFFETLQDIQKEHPRADVINDEKAYYAFRSALQTNSKAPKLKVSARPDSTTSSKFGSQLSQPPSQRQSGTARTIMQVQQPSAPGSSNNSRPATPAEMAATKIQAAYRGHFVRNHPEKFGLDTTDLTRRSSTDRLLSSDNKKDLKRHSVGGYSLETITNSPDDRAATRIQAEIRGYLARRHVEAMKQKNLEAATKIQAHIRGYLTRKKLHDGEENNSPARSRQSVNSNA